MPRAQNPIFAVGYSNRTMAEFVGMLKAHSVGLLVDVRTIPRSRHQPQFNEAALRSRLRRDRIGYRHMAGLGGLRKPRKDSVNRGWRNDSFRGFADYMQTREFAGAVIELIKVSKKRRIAIMCAEGNPFRCHRSLIADALAIRGRKVFHISGVASGRPHVVTPFAKVRGTKVTYP